MFNKLRRKFILITMLSVILVLAIIVSGINILSYRSTVTNADGILNLLADNDGAFPEMKFPDSVNTESDSDEQHSAPPDIQSDTDNPFMKHSDFMDSPELQYETRYFSVVLSTDGSIISTDTGRIAAVDSTKARELAREVYDSGKEKGFVGDYRFIVTDDDSGIRIIFYDCGRSLDSFRAFLEASLLISFAAIILMFLLIFFASGKIVRPVAESYEKQKRFITDAGHEIKTPLAIINADADVLLMDGDNEWVRDIKAQTGRLTELTNNLIFLSKMEESRPALQVTNIDLSSLVNETADSFTAMFITQNKTLERKVDSGVGIEGDKSSLTQLVSILLDNALKYSPEKTATVLELKKTSKEIKLYCANETVTPVTEEDAKHLFDRFYRTDKSRNSGTGGQGIGLSIARAVVTAHKGKISAVSDGKTLTIKAKIPL